MSKNLQPENARGKYQCLDPLSPEDFKALEADILERGVQLPIEFDEDGNVIDGHHRLRICVKHGIEDYPKIIRAGLTEQEKRTHARRMNLCRRHVTPEQRRRLIEQELRENPNGSNRSTAAALGVHHTTVGTVRAGLEAGGEISQVEQRVGADGKVYAMASTAVRRTPRTGGEISQVETELAALDNMLTELKRRMLDLARVRSWPQKQEQLVRRDVARLQKLLGELAASEMEEAEASRRFLQNQARQRNRGSHPGGPITGTRVLKKGPTQGEPGRIR